MDTASLLLETCGTGELEAVKIIVGGLGADVNTTSAYRFVSTGETITIEGASPLFLAAGNCNLEIAKYLIDKGANVNSLTSVIKQKYAGMSPLHAAVSLRRDKSWIQKRAMVELLISSGADSSALTAKGSSIWMLCHDENVERHLLIDFAVSLTQQFPGKNCVALHHWASSRGYSCAFDKHYTVPVVELLLTKGADPKALDYCGLTPLNVAAVGYPRYGSHLGPNEPVLRYFLNRDDTSLLEKIDALELAGAMLLLEKESDSSISQALGYWDEAQDLRDSAQGSVPKIPLKVNKIIPWRIVEWTTRDELKELQHRPLAEKKIQALLVGRRILSRVNSRALAHHLWDGFADNYSFRLLSANRYTELLDFCWIMLEGARGHGPEVNDELWSMIVRVTCYLFMAFSTLKNQRNPILNLETLNFGLQLVLEMNIRSPQLSAVGYAYYTSVIDPIIPISHLVAILSESPKMMTHETKCCLHQFVKRDGRNSSGYNLLLTLCNQKPTTGSLAAIALLLEVGADANAKDGQGNSALHLVAYWMEEEDTDSPTAELLLKHRAHVDAANKLQETPLDVWKKKNEKEGRILTPPAWMNSVLSLSCWSARSIQLSKIPYDHLSKSVRDFVAIH